VQEITSRQNGWVKKARAIGSGRDRGRILVEGYRLFADALEARVPFEVVMLSREALEEVGSAIPEERILLCTDEVLDAASDLQTHQEIIGMAPRPVHDPAVFFGGEPSLVLALDGVQDPGNVGSLVRSAEAAGADGVMVLPGTADPYSPKAMRGAMGSSLRLPILFDVTPEQAASLQAVGADVRGEMAHTEYPWVQSTLLIMGREGTSGLSKAAEAFQPTFVRIDQNPAVDSLNVGAAAAVLLFEARRQRTS
jgi:TrmH family RNA methyltransferase